MFSKILIKLIDQAILPAILLLVARIASLLFFARVFSADYTVTNTGFTFYDTQAYVTVNSYSLLVMQAILAFGIFYVLIKSFVFHDSHIKPRLTAKLFSLNMSSFIQTSFDLYSQGAVWLSYVYLMFLVSTFLAFFSLVHSWVFFVSFVIAILSTVALVFDIEDEMHINSGIEDQELLDIEEYVLKFEVDEK